MKSFRLRTLFCLISVCCVGFFFLASNLHTADRQFQRASSAYDQEEYSAAAERFGEFLANHPEDLRAREAKLLLDVCRIRVVAKRSLPAAVAMIEDRFSNIEGGEVERMVLELAKHACDQAEIGSHQERGEWITVAETALASVAEPDYLPRSGVFHSRLKVHVVIKRVVMLRYFWRMDAAIDETLADATDDRIRELLEQFPFSENDERLKSIMASYHARQDDSDESAKTK